MALLAPSMVAIGGSASTDESRVLDVQTFRVNVTSSGQHETLDQELSIDHAYLQIPDQARRLHLSVDWADGGPQQLRLEILPDSCLTLCQRPVAVIEGQGPLETTVNISQDADPLHVHATSSGEAKAAQPVEGTARFLAPVSERPAEPASTAPTGIPSQAEPADRWSDGVIGLAGMGAAAAILLVALRSIANRLLPGVGLFSRFDRDELLDHPVRRRIVETVEDRPGIHLEAFVRRLDLGRGQLEHHLSQLVQADLLVEHESTGYRAYFRPAQLEPPLREALVRLKADGARDLLRAVADHPEAGIRELSRRTGLAPSTVSYHARRLEEADLVSIKRSSQAKELAPTQLARQALRMAD